MFKSEKKRSEIIENLMNKKTKLQASLKIKKENVAVLTQDLMDLIKKVCYLIKIFVNIYLFQKD